MPNKLSIASPQSLQNQQISKHELTPDKASTHLEQIDTGRSGLSASHLSDNIDMRKPQLQTTSNFNEDVFVLVENWDSNLAPSPVVATTPLHEYIDDAKNKTMLSSLARYKVNNADWIAHQLDQLEGMDATTDKIERAGKSASTIQSNDIVLYGFLTGKTVFGENNLNASENHQSIGDFLNDLFKNHIKKSQQNAMPIKINHLAFIGELLSKPEMFLLTEYTKNKSTGEPSELKHKFNVKGKGTELGWKFGMSRDARLTQLKQISAFYDKLQNQKINNNPQALKLVQQFMRNIVFTQCVKSLRAGESYENLQFCKTYCPDGKVNAELVIRDLKPLSEPDLKHSPRQDNLPIYSKMPEALIEDHKKFVMGRLSS